MGLAEGIGQSQFKPRLRVVVGGKIYDVTEFADRHPGGREVLEKHNGQNVEEAMQNPAVHGHTKSAFVLLEKYFVGNVDSLRSK
ncbi:unnamed protein product, partial [Candidula unifasciata]